MVAVPAFLAVTSPVDETVATVLSLLFQVYPALYASEGVMVAFILSVEPTLIVVLLLLSLTL